MLQSLDEGGHFLCYVCELKFVTPFELGNFGAAAVAEAPSILGLFLRDNYALIESLELENDRFQDLRDMSYLHCNW